MYKFLNKHIFALIGVFLVLCFFLFRMEEEARLSSSLAPLVMFGLTFFCGFSIFEYVKTGRMRVKGSRFSRAKNPIIFWLLIAVYSVGFLALSYVTFNLAAKALNVG